MEVSGQLHAPAALPRGKTPSIPIAPNGRELYHLQFLLQAAVQKLLDTPSHIHVCVCVHTKGTRNIAAKYYQSVLKKKKYSVYTERRRAEASSHLLAAAKK